MFELFHDINWVLIGTLIAVSALVSWAGDVIGMKLGKKRITFMNLRPRYTSRIISVLTGVGIALATILTLSVASEEVRTALFSMQVIQRQLTSTREELKKNEETISRMELDLFQSRGDLAEKEEELNSVEKQLEEEAEKLKKTQAKLSEMTVLRDKMRSEQQSLHKEKEKLLSESKKLETSISSLKKEADALKSGIQRLREGRIAAFSDEVLAQTVITGSPITETQIGEYTEKLRGEARSLLAYRFGIKDPEKIKLPNVTAASSNAVRNRLAGAYGRWLMRLTAAGNAVEGEDVNTQLETYPSMLVYKEGRVLYSHTFATKTPRSEIEETISQALRTLNQRAVKDGVLRDPLTGNVGSLDSGDLIDAIDSIEHTKNSITLEIVTERDIYSEGPLRVKCDLKNQ